MNQGRGIRLVATDLAMSLKLEKGESKTTADILYPLSTLEQSSDDLYI